MPASRSERVPDVAGSATAPARVPDPLVAPEERRRLRRRFALILAAYALLLALATTSVAANDLVYWFGFVLPALVLTVLAFRWVALSPSQLGLTMANARQALRRAAVTAPLLIALGAVTILVARDQGWVDPSTRLLDPRIDGQFWLYLVVAVPLQEVIFRGLFQQGARAALGPSRAGTWGAVGLSTLGFALCHLPWGVDTMAVMVVPGLVWGLQAARDRTLLGVTVSHAVAGFALLGLMPFWRLLDTA